MWQGPVHPDVIALNSALSACASANRWEVAMQLGRAMAAMGQGIYVFFGMSQENPKKKDEESYTQILVDSLNQL